MTAIIPKEAVTRFLGRNTPKFISYPGAALGGSVLAVCSCNIVPLFAGIYKKGVGIGKTSVYRAVQEVTKKKVPGMRQEKLAEGYRTKAVGADVTSNRCNGKWVPLGIAVDATNGSVLSNDELPGEDAEQLKAWLAPILEAVDADVLVTDDANAFKKVSDETGRLQCARAMWVAIPRPWWANSPCRCYGVAGQ